MAESLKTILMSALTAKATPAETDTMIVGEGNVLKKITFSQLFTYLKDKLGINTLNTNLGKTARFYAVGKFYVPGSSGDYSGLAIGGTAWSNIVGVQYVSATDYKHYYTLFFIFSKVFYLTRYFACFYAFCIRDAVFSNYRLTYLFDTYIL